MSPLVEGLAINSHENLNLVTTFIFSPTLAFITDVFSPGNSVNEEPLRVSLNTVCDSNLILYKWELY